MKMKKFIAPSTGAALAKVKEEFGDAAIVLSTRTTPRGIEILASVEDELNGLVSDAQSIAAEPVGFTPVSIPSTGTPLTPDYFSGAQKPAAREGSKMFSFTEWLRRKSASEAKPQSSATASLVQVGPLTGSAAPAASGTVAAPPPPDRVPSQRLAAEPAVRAAPARPVMPQAAQIAPREQIAERDLAPRRPTMPLFNPNPVTDMSADPPHLPQTQNSAALADELRALRGLVEHHLLNRSTGNAESLAGLAGELLPQLLAAGFSTVLARTLANACPDDRSLADARRWLQGHIADALQFVDAGAEIVERGGAYALTGPTGVGKTTTAAKIAARCVVKFGAQSLGLVTTDTYRIGAPDQLRIYGKILGVPVHTVQDANGLKQALETLRTKRLVLVDTVGLGQRDERVQELLTLLDECGVGRLLLLAAPSQLATLDDVVHAYRGATSVGAIVSKIDEAAQLGSIVDVLMRRKLSLHYVSTGQRVPEDLQIPDRAALVAKALRVPVSTLYIPSSDEAQAVTAAIGRWSVRGTSAAHG